MRNKAIITVGISGSGKSTWASSIVDVRDNWTEINRDQIRASLVAAERGISLADAADNLWNYWKFGKREAEVTTIQTSMIEECAKRGEHIIISDTNLDANKNAALKARLEALGYEVDFQKFPITLEEAWKRDEKRKASVGRDVIYKQYLKWLEFYGPKLVHDETLCPAIIVDIDGTLAHMNGRGPFDWDKVDQDTVDPFVAGIVRGMYESDIAVIIMSGRDSVCRAKTEKWLVTNNIPYDYLFMRAQEDMRKDSIVKEELYMNYVHGKYNVVRVIDDRPQVCRKWRELGLKVVQVADPYLEF